jgi:hypothetical protein
MAYNMIKPSGLVIFINAGWGLIKAILFAPQVETNFQLCSKYSHDPIGTKNKTSIVDPSSVLPCADNDGRSATALRTTIEERLKRHSSYCCIFK